MKKWFLRALMLVALVAAAAAAVLGAMVCMGLANDKHTWAPPAGMHVDAGRMAATHVNRTVMLSPDSAEAVSQLGEALRQARAQGLKIAVAGARHSMGGQSVFPEGILIDMLDHKRMTLDSTAGPDGTRVLHVGAGARWSDVIPFLDARGCSVWIMQSNNPFTVGGTLSVNAHGWQHNRPPFVSSVEAFRLFAPDGSIKNCSRSENPELFRLAAGGYGLFGVILDVDLRVVPNVLYRAARERMAAREYPARYHASIDGDTSLGLVYGRLSIAPTSFLEKAVLTRYARVPAAPPRLHKSAGAGPDETLLWRFKQLMFEASVGSAFGKEVRWFLEQVVGGESASEDTRNQILNDPIDLFDTRDSTRTQLLHEYFIPRDSLEAFLKGARRIIPAHHGDLLNVTVRNLAEDKDAFLRYARRDDFSFVMLFSQPRTPAGDSSMAAMTRDLIDCALGAGGVYYLPYRLHATHDQFRRAYPMAQEFFALKRRYDPEEIFQNKLYQEYGHD